MEEWVGVMGPFINYRGRMEAGVGVMWPFKNYRTRMNVDDHGWKQIKIMSAAGAYLGIGRSCIDRVLINERALKYYL